MKKIHLILLITAAITALTSVYSLAAINQTYKIAYEWFSGYKEVYSADRRDTSRDKWQADGMPSGVSLAVIPQKDMFFGDEGLKESKAFDMDFDRYLAVCASLGKVDSLEYRIKVSDIAQRGDVVEIIVSLNSPPKSAEKIDGGSRTFYPFDIIRIEKNAFPVKGRLLFIFKNQDGVALGQQYCYIK